MRVDGLRRGGAYEVESLALSHADALYNLARWLVRNPSDAEDLVQETYARALASAAQFEAGSNLKAWLFRILRNSFLDRRRAAKLQITEPDLAGLDESLPLEALPGELQSEQIRTLVAEQVAEAVHALPEVWRTVIMLDLEGLTEREAASVLGCAEGTIKSRLSRARAELRKRLAEHGG